MPPPRGGAHEQHRENAEHFAEGPVVEPQTSEIAKAMDEGLCSYGQSREISRTLS